MVDAIYSMLTGWSEIDRYTALGLFLGLIAISLNTFSVRKASAQAALLLHEARTELKNNISSRILRPGRTASLTGFMIRETALDIQELMHSPVITDPMIAESIREVMLQVENEFDGRERVHKIEILARLLEDFEPRRIQPMSIAFTDRLFAYRLSVLSLSLVLLSAQFVLTSVSSKYLLAALAVWILPFLQLLLFYSNVRAFRLWKDDSTTMRYEKSAGSLRGKKPTGRLVDFLPLQTMTSHHNVHTAWAPIWEELMFRLVPLQVLPIFGAWMAYQVGKLFGADEYSLKSIVKWTVIIMFSVGIYISVVVFSKWHQYKYFELKKLQREFDSARKQIFVARFRQLPLRREDFEKYITLCRRIWSITGLPYFREAEKRI